MSLEYIRKTYGVPVALNADVIYTGGKKPQLGRIIGTRGRYLNVQFFNGSRPYSLIIHPTWRLQFPEKLGTC